MTVTEENIIGLNIEDTKRYSVYDIIYDYFELTDYIEFQGSPDDYMEHYPYSKFKLYMGDKDIWLKEELIKCKSHPETDDEQIVIDLLCKDTLTMTEVLNRTSYWSSHRGPGISHEEMRDLPISHYGTIGPWSPKVMLRQLWMLYREIIDG